MALKRIILWMLVVVLLVSMCGCGAAQEETEPSSVPSPSASAAEPTLTPEPEPTPTPEPVPTPVSKTEPAYHFTDQIQERGVLIVGGAVNNAASYIIPDDPETYGELAGTRDGYVLAVCRRIAEELGVEVECIEYENLEALLQAVVDGDVDLASGTFVITEERLALYEMTDRFDVVNEEGYVIYFSTNPEPWLPPEEALEADSDSDADPDEEIPIEPEPREMIQSEEELVHARIAIVNGSVQGDHTAKQYPEAELYPLASNEEVLEALATGQVDAGVFTSYIQEFQDQIVEAIYEGTIVISGYSVENLDFHGQGMILMKGNEELCQTINEILGDLMESGWLTECYKAEEIKAVERGIIPPEAMHFRDSDTDEEP